MNSLYSALLPAAMVGTDKQPASVPVLPGELGVLAQNLAQTAQHDGERLMNLAALLAAAAQAGARGYRYATALPSAAAAESLPAADTAEQRALLHWVFDQTQLRLQVRVCLALAAKQGRLPDLVLPAALDAGQHARELRVPLQAVLGERGRWLAQWTPAWAYAAGGGAAADEEQRWAEGSFDQRRALLRAERVHAPAAARERLAAALNELPARERVELLSALAVNLSLEDEALLQAQLSDRSREVKQLAAGLLSGLPESAFAQRAIARVNALLSPKGVIEAPAAFADEWKGDALESARPNSESLGERAWWLYQLARRVPLNWWSQRLSKTPEQLLRWAKDGDWAEALLRAWRHALDLRPLPDWCEALLDDWPSKLLRDDPAQVLALLPLARREKYWQQQLAGKWGVRDLSVGPLGANILAACPHDESISTELSLRLIERIAKFLTADALQRDWQLREVLPELAVMLARDSLVQLAALPFPPDATPALREVALRLDTIIKIRRTFDF